VNFKVTNAFDKSGCTYFKNVTILHHLYMRVFKMCFLFYMKLLVCKGVCGQVHA